MLFSIKYNIIITALFLLYVNERLVSDIFPLLLLLYCDCDCPILFVLSFNISNYYYLLVPA